MKTVDFSEIIAACDLKLGMSIERQGHVHIKIKTGQAFLRNHWAILTKFCMQAFRYMEMNIYMMLIT